MSDGKEDCSPHGWTLDTLETHLCSKIEALARLVEERELRSLERARAAKDAVAYALAAADKALTKAEMASERRFEGVNEFRATLSDQAARLVSRAEFTAQYQSLSDKIDATTMRLAALESSQKGKSEGLGMIGTITLGAIAGMASLVSVATLLVNIFRR